jgi:hypothetical protein
MREGGVQDDACDGGLGVVAQVGEQAQASARGSDHDAPQTPGTECHSIRPWTKLFHAFVYFVYFVVPTALPQSLGRIVARWEQARAYREYAIALAVCPTAYASAIRASPRTQR